MQFSKAALLNLVGFAAFVFATPTPEAAAVSTPGNILARFSHPSFAKREGDAAEDIVLHRRMRACVKSSFCIWICPSTAGVCCGDNGSCVVC